MKKIIAIVAVAVAVTMSGCAGIYAAFGTTPEAVHNAAVQKVSDYAEAAINKKIEASENLSEAGKAKLKAEVAKLKAEILAKIEEIRAKTKTGEAAK
jgi:uncharacterized protein YceK